MKKKAHSIDGFIPRRIGGELGQHHEQKREITDVESMGRPLHASEKTAQSLGEVNREISADRKELEDSMKSIDDSAEKTKNPRKGLMAFLKRKPKVPGKKRKVWKWILLVVVLALLGVGGYFGYKIFLANGNVFEGSIFDIVQHQPLKQDKNGRSNFLLLGTSEDDPGHGGAWLTDSMMIVSLDQTNKNAFMFSIPRDLYVEYGRACNSGYSGKINEFFSCVNPDFDKKNKAAEQERLSETQKFLGNIFGLDIQYGIHINNKVLKDAVNAVGGVDVDIQGSNGAPGILDRNFDWRCNYECYYVYYENGVHHLDGEHALFLAMARGDVAPTYGLANSNFDREKNQQKIILALRDKAISTGTLTNISKVTGLIDALGNNLRTNIAVKEIRTLIDLASQIDQNNIKSISLVDTKNPVMTSGPYNGASVVMPIAGVFNYTQVQDYVGGFLVNAVAYLDKAKIAVYNGSSQDGLAQTEADKLKAKKFTVKSVKNAPEGEYGQYEIYVVNSEKSATVKQLESIYGISAKTSELPFEVNGVDIVLILGSKQ